MIDAQINPGPYKEILPCIDLCYNLEQSCPAALGFACPLEGHGMNYSYGKPASCNNLGMLQSAAGLMVVNSSGMLLGMLITLIAGTCL